KAGILSLDWAETVPEVPRPLLPAAAPASTAWTAAPPLIGRRQEWDRVVGALRRTAQHGHGHVVLLRGEAGIGKTRLMTEVLAAAVRAALPGAGFGTVLMGRAYESMAGVPYAALVDALAPAWAAQAEAGGVARCVAAR